jgi:hypothetical protein
LRREDENRRHRREALAHGGLKSVAPGQFKTDQKSYLRRRERELEQVKEVDVGWW